jgi:prepilin-type N-terminal cleavage/methylation domain-containing protein
MCSARNNSRRRLGHARRAFTLLEVMISVAILALVAGSIYRFVVVDLQAIKISTDDTAQKQAIQSLVSVLQEEFCNLPLGQQNTFLGEAHKFSEKSSDQIEWLSEAGNGLFTEAATGTWKVTLLLRPQEKSNTSVLGILRQLPDNSSKDTNWLPLLPNVDAIEVRYFDQRLNTWLDKWSDSANRPSLVRLRIWRTDQTVPYETIIELPPTRLPT